MNIQLVANALALLSYSGLIYLVLRQGWRGNRTNQYFALYLFTMVLWQITYLMLVLSTNAAQALLWYKLIVAIISGQFIVYSFFTRAFLQLESKKRLVQLGLLVWLITAAIGLFMHQPLIYAGIHRDVATGLFVPDFGPLLPLVAAPNYIFLGYAVYHLLRAYHNTRSSLQRSRIQYLVLGLGVVVLGLATNFYPRLQPYPIDVGANILNGLLIAYAILRYQLLDIRLVVRKGMVYLIPTAIIGTGYFLVVFLAINFFPAVPGRIMLSFIMATITALAAQPLRDRVQSSVDRLFFREKYDSTRMLQQLSSTVASVLDLDRLTDMILDAVVATMHVQKAAIFLKHEDSGEFHLAAQHGLGPEDRFALRADHPVVRWLCDHDGILTQQMVQVLPQFKALWGKEKEDLEQMRAELFVPLRAKGSLVGIFAVGSKLSEQAYSLDDQLTLTTLANQTAVAVMNARLYATARHELAQRTRMEQELQLLNATLEQRVRQRTFDIELLYELSQKIGYMLDPVELLRLVMDGLRRAIPYDACAGIVVVDDRRDALIQPARPLAAAVSLEIQHRLAASFARARGQALELGPVRRFEATPSDPTAAPLTHLGSALEVPLIVGEEQEAVGVLLVVAEEAGAFSADHIRLLQTVAGQASLAIQRLSMLLAAEHERQENLIERLPEGVLLLNADGRIVLANPVGRAHLELLTDARMGDVLASLGEQPLSVLLGPPPQGAICHEVVLKSAPYKVFEVISRRVDIGPQAGGWVLVLRDVTERKQQEKERARLEAQFRQAQKMEAVGLLAGGVAHDFNNLLTVIQGNAELGLLQLDADHPVRKELSIVLKTAERAAKLTRQLLAFSRRQLLQLEDVEINSLIHSFAEMAEPLIGEHIELHLSLTPGLRPVRADKNALEQALMNLAVNARDAMPEGGQLSLETAPAIITEETVHLHSEARPGEYIRVTVADTGMGMDEDTLKHIFEPFFTTKEVGKGTGLGLAMVYGVVKQHGGWIEVKSQIAKGTTFDLYLPINERGGQQPHGESENVAVPTGRETILLAEDEEDVRNLACSVLKGLGYQVLVAETGQAAVELFRANPECIQLVILDVVMPRLSGPKAYEMMHAIRPVPALFITGYGAEMATLAREAGMGVNLLHKPFAVAQLGQKVREVLDQARVQAH